MMTCGDWPFQGAELLVRAHLFSYRAHALAKRFSSENVEEMIRRYEAGESATALATAHGVAPSALIRQLRESHVVVKKRLVPDDVAKTMAEDYQVGATMRELETKYGLSHGAVLRALHHLGVQMRAKAPRRKSVSATAFDVCFLLTT